MPYDLSPGSTTDIKIPAPRVNLQRSVLFEASFEEEALRAQLVADQEADINLTTLETFELMVTIKPNTQLTSIQLSFIYSEITGDKVIHYAKQKTANI